MRRKAPSLLPGRRRQVGQALFRMPGGRRSVDQARGERGLCQVAAGTLRPRRSCWWEQITSGFGRAA